jgi:hypothetical protein
LVRFFVWINIENDLFINAKNPFFFLERRISFQHLSWDSCLLPSGSGAKLSGEMEINSWGKEIFSLVNY